MTSTYENRYVPALPDVPMGWNQINWRFVHRKVRGTQIRIAKATKVGDWRKVKSLQRLLIRSFYGKALAVKRVTENRGKRTAGVDGVVWSTPEAKWEAVLSLSRRGYRPRPLKRVYIPKQHGKKRPLGIPTMMDRAMQALYLLALEPVSETLADRDSYGFRLERSTADAIEQCFITLSRKYSARWVLEGDIEGCFDNINHDWLINHTPLDKVVLRKWLKAGYVDSRLLFPTKAGTPQGGIISPTLANLALDGLEGELESHFGTRNTKKSYKHKVNLVRYADDFIITGISKELLEDEVKPLVEKFLAKRGLRLSSEKTRVTHIEEGFDFLGQNVRKYNGKMLIKPSRKNVNTFLEKVREIVKGNPTLPQADLIRMLNPVIRGWANYHRHVVAKKIFGWVDFQLWKLLWSWSRRRHPNKGRRWIRKRYFQSIGSRHWVFADRQGNSVDDGLSDRAVLVYASDIPIQRHTKIKGEANPFDPCWETYFEARVDAKMKGLLKPRSLLRGLWMEQSGKCLLCNAHITFETGWHSHHLIQRVAGGSDKADNLVLLHPNCHMQLHSEGLSVRKPGSFRAL